VVARVEHGRDDAQGSANCELSRSEPVVSSIVVPQPYYIPPHAHVFAYQIQTLSRRAAKIYEESFSPGEVAPHDKDSVSLLLALRNSGDSTARPNQSTHGGNGNGPGGSGSGSRDNTPMQPPQSLPPRNAFPGITSGAGHFVNGLSMHQSPASTGSNSAEDDHSQRLLDHWLNANHSLAVGSINGQAPPLDPAGLGYLPMPGLPGLGAGLPVSTPGFGYGGGGFASVGAATGGGGGGGGGWGPDTFVGLPGVPAPTPTGMDYFGQPPGPFGVGTVPTPSHAATTHTPTGAGHGVPPGTQTLTQAQAQAQGQFGAQGLEGAFAGTGVVSGGVEGENSDEYWNALIDGESTWAWSQSRLARLASLAGFDSAGDSFRRASGDGWS
jgi:hypothetical protein